MVTLTLDGDNVAARSNGDRVLFELLLFDKSDHRSAASTKWTSDLQPTLTVLLGDAGFRRINGFVAAYAVARAAKASGVAMPRCEPQVHRTPDAITDDQQPYYAHSEGTKLCARATADPDLLNLCGWDIACGLEAEAVIRNGGGDLTTVFDACVHRGLVEVCSGTSDARCIESKKKSFEQLRNRLQTSP